MGYLEKSWGEPVDGISMDDIKEAIHQIQEMNEEYGAFWVGMGADENTLEVSKDLSLVALFADNPGHPQKAKGKNWGEIETLFSYFLAERYDLLRKALA